MDDLSKPITAPVSQRPVININGDEFMKDAKGRHVPVRTIRAMDLLKDDCVRKILAFALPLAAEIARFREHCFDDVDGFSNLVSQEYGVTRDGQKGNMTLETFDGLYRVQVQVSDNITFGPELQAAKALVDECLTDWSSGSRPELRAIIDRAFRVDKEGKINKEELLGLRRLEITDARWINAMRALTDSITVTGSKRYIRFYQRETATDKWEPIVIDLASSR